MIDEIWKYFQVQNNREVVAFFAGGLVVAFSWVGWIAKTFIKYRISKKASSKETTAYRFQDGDLEHYNPKLVRKYIYGAYGYSFMSGEANLGYLVIVYGGYETHRESASDMDIVVLVDKHVQNPDELPEQKVFFDPNGFIEISDYHFLKFWRNLVIGMPHAISVVIDGRVLENHNMNILEFEYLRSMALDLTYHTQYLAEVIYSDIEIYSELRKKAMSEERADLLARLIFMESSCWVQCYLLKKMDMTVSWEEIYPLAKPEKMVNLLNELNLDLADKYQQFRNIQKGRIQNPGIKEICSVYHDFELSIREN